MSNLRLITGAAHPAHGARLSGPQEGAEGEPRRRPLPLPLGLHGRKMEFHGIL